MQAYQAEFVARGGGGGGTTSAHLFSIGTQDHHQQQQQQEEHQQQQELQSALLAATQQQQQSLQHQLNSQSRPQHLQIQLPKSPDLGSPNDHLDERNGGSRWPREATLALIKIRTEMDTSFRDSGLKAPLWEEVSRRMAEQGFLRSAKKCKEKFENIHKYYRKTKGGRQDGKNYRFFDELEALNKSGSFSRGPGGAPGEASLGQGNLADPSDTPTFFLPGGASTNPSASSSEPFKLSENNSDVAVNLYSSDESSEEYDDPEEGGGTRKRKRRSRIASLERVVRRFVAKQEVMQRRFLEALDRHEQERCLKEEALRKHEMTRLRREQELLAQERSLAASRDAALLAFFQKVTGQTLSLQLLPPQLVTSPVNRPEHPDEQQQEVELGDPHSKRWPDHEVHALIKLRSSMEPKFQEPGAKGPLWEEISSGMEQMGFKRSAKRCKEKWENINKYFRKTKDSKKRPENSKTCRYFPQLDMLYRTGVLTPPNSRLMVADHAANGQHGASTPMAQKMLAILPAEAVEKPPGPPAAAQVIFSAASPENNGNSKTPVEKTSEGNPATVSGFALQVGEQYPGINTSTAPRLQLGQEMGQKEIMQAETLRRHHHQQQHQHHQQHQHQHQHQQQQQQVERSNSVSNRASSKDAALIALVHQLTQRSSSPAERPLEVSSSVAGAVSN